jgi:hypothetical protein
MKHRGQTQPQVSYHALAFALFYPSRLSKTDVGELAPTKLKIDASNAASSRTGADGGRTHDLRLAKPALSQLSYSPAWPRRSAARWAQVESNYRPYPYQGYALAS